MRFDPSQGVTCSPTRSQKKNSNKSKWASIKVELVGITCLGVSVLDQKLTEGKKTQPLFRKNSQFFSWGQTCDLLYRLNTNKLRSMGKVIFRRHKNLSIFTIISITKTRFPTGNHHYLFVVFHKFTQKSFHALALVVQVINVSKKQIFYFDFFTCAITLNSILNPAPTSAAKLSNPADKAPSLGRDLRDEPTQN